jgi:hypothetical protein
MGKTLCCGMMVGLLAVLVAGCRNTSQTVPYGEGTVVPSNSVVVPAPTTGMPAPISAPTYAPPTGGTSVTTPSTMPSAGTYVPTGTGLR